MKQKNNLFKFSILVTLALLHFTHLSIAQDSIQTLVKKPFLRLSYTNSENKLQCLSFNASIKTGQELKPVTKQKLKIYFEDAENPKNEIAELITDFSGKAVLPIPESMQTYYKTNNPIKFIARMDSLPDLGVLETEIEVTKAKLLVEATENDNKRIVKVVLLEKSDSSFIPAPDVEIKLGIKRLSSILPFNEESSFTTDSTGSITAEYTIDSIPGNNNGEIVLVAKVEEHELYGTLENETKVNWGNINMVNQGLYPPSLWTPGDQVPLWLLILALSIICSVWCTLLFLFIQIFKIKKLGKA